MWDVSLSQCGSWECKSSWMWGWVGVWVVTNISNECSALTFTVQRSRTACLLKMKALWSFIMSGTSNPWHSIILQKMWIPIATTVCKEGEKWHTDLTILWLQGGHAIGQAHQSPLTTEVCVQTQGGRHGFILNKFILGQVFLWDSVVFIPPMLFHHRKLVQQAPEPRNSSLTATSK